METHSGNSEVEQLQVMVNEVDGYPINREHISRNYNSRITQIILHHTAEGFGNSLITLDGFSKAEVSSHYLINNQPSSKYPDYIYNLVPEELRSWHAGVSRWYHDTDLNNSSIGIEIVNDDGNKYAYPEKQIEGVMALVKHLIKKYNIKPVNIIGHSDIAPLRKIDPGKLFPWKELYENGIGAWYDESDVESYREKIKTLPNLKLIKTYLNTYGYGIDVNEPSDGDEYRAVVKAFQRHFAPEKVDGVMKLENYHILRALLKKYRSIE